MKKKVKIFKRLIKWILISVFSTALILFIIIYFSSKKIEGYWVNSNYVQYDVNKDSTIGISNDVFLFKNFRHYDLFRNEKSKYYVFNNILYLYIKDDFGKNIKLVFKIVTNENNFTLIRNIKKKHNYTWRSKYKFNKIPNSYFNRPTEEIIFKNKSFKVINGNYTNTLHFKDSTIKSRNIRFKTKFQKQKWKRVQKNGLDILFLGVNNDVPYFILDKKDSVITLKKIEDKEIDIQFIEIRK